jgi:hypothetical protein
MLYFLLEVMQALKATINSNDAVEGLNKPMLPRLTNFEYFRAGPISVQLGVRYMFNSKVGNRLGGEYNMFKS